MEVFGLMFVVSFMALLTTLVILHIRKSLNNGKGDIIKEQEVGNWFPELMIKTSIQDTNKDFNGYISYDTGSGKDYSVESMLRQNSDEDVEFIECKWIDESWMKREVNEAQEKWKLTVPKHRTRIKARNKRKQRNKR